MRLRLSWARWSRTRQLRRPERDQRRELALSLMLEQQHQKVVTLEKLLLPSPPPPPQLESRPPTPTPAPTPLEEETPQLTEEERASLPPMPEPVEEIERLLGLSTTPASAPTSRD